jgi:glycosyltransferase
MKVSMVTVVYNRAQCVVRAIKSVQQQSYQNIEHVIVDGASTDGTLEIIRDHINKNTIVLSEPDGGIYDALNKGFRLSSGDVIGILHSDDVLYDDKSD